MIRSSCLYGPRWKGHVLVFLFFFFVTYGLALHPGVFFPPQLRCSGYSSTQAAHKYFFLLDWRLNVIKYIHMCKLSHCLATVFCLLQNVLRGFVTCKAKFRATFGTIYSYMVYGLDRLKTFGCHLVVRNDNLLSAHKSKESQAQQKIQSQIYLLHAFIVLQHIFWQVALKMSR